jgi:hypothetical protein
MPRSTTKLTPTAGGGFSARKRIPADVREAYGRLYGRTSEEWFNSGPVPIDTARAKCREWQSAIEARFTNIRAERKGQGRTLTPMEARALSGDWYQWWTTRNLAKPVDLKYWQGSYDFYCDAAHDGAVLAAIEPGSYGPPDHWHGPATRNGSKTTKRAHTLAP